MKNFKKSTSWLFLFWIIGSIHIISLIVHEEVLSQVTKPLIMISLGLYFFYRTRPLSAARLIFPLLAIIFSWLGDVFLMFQKVDERWFIFGLAAFLLAQIAYIITYRKYMNDRSVSRYSKIKLPMYTGLIIYAVILWSRLFPTLGDYLLPVTIYTLTILLMTLMSVARLGRTSITSFALVASGAFLFLLSDSVIALNKFHASIPQERLIVMATYISGQFLIIRGLANHSFYSSG